MISTVISGCIHDGCTALYLDCGHSLVIHSEVGAPEAGAEVDCTTCDGPAGDMRRLRADLATAHRRIDEAEAALLLAREALTPLAHGLDGWPYAADPARDIGRMNYDTSITVADVEKARAVLAETAGRDRARALERLTELSEDLGLYEELK